MIPNMRALLLTRYGGPAAAEFREVARPEPGPGAVLIRVRAAGLNPVDYKIRQGMLKPVHFLKVSHHGSHNGTPADDIFEAILPAAPPDNRQRQAVISTWENTYPGIPDAPTSTRLAERATVHPTLDRRDEPFFEVTFPG